MSFVKNVAYKGYIIGPISQHCNKCQTLHSSSIRNNNEIARRASENLFANNWLKYCPLMAFVKLIRSWYIIENEENLRKSWQLQWILKFYIK